MRVMLILLILLSLVSCDNSNDMLEDESEFATLDETDDLEQELEDLQNEIDELKRTRTVTLVNGEFQVLAGGFREFSVDIPDFESATFKGSFTSQGGGDDLINVFFFDELNFRRWRDNEDSEALYISGEVVSDEVERVISSPGLYYLVFFSQALLFPRQVTANFTITYIEKRM